MNFKSQTLKSKSKTISNQSFGFSTTVWEFPQFCF
jgi:hypothetical protein